MNRLLLLDAYALIYRAYYAFINRPMRNSKGLNTSAIYGFIKSVIDVQKKFNPTHIAVGFDLSGPTFRTDIYPEYKAQREATPEDIRVSVPIIKELLQAMCISIVEMKGFEADDVIGALAKQANSSEFEVIMVTPDKDYSQLLAPNISIAKPARNGNEMQLVTDEEFCKHHRLKSPMQFIDVLALWGDASDNIKGVNKIGEKTAFKLISEYGSIDNLLQNTVNLTPALKQNLDEAHKLLDLNRVLVTIRTDLDLHISYDDLAIKPVDSERLLTMLEDLEFRQLMVDFGLVAQSRATTLASTSAVQGSLFDSVEPAAEPAQVEQSLRCISDFDVDYKVAATPEERRQLIALLAQCKEFAFDTETTGIDTVSASLVGISVAMEKNVAWWIPIPSVHAEALLVVQEFRAIFENPDIAKIGQNVKFDMQMLAGYGVEVKGFLYDTMLAHYLLFPDSHHNLDLLAENLLGYRTIKIEELIGKKGSGQTNMRVVPLDRITPYACEDADIALQLKEVLFPMLNAECLTDLYKTIEEPLIEVLSTMELNGVCIDSKSLNEYGEVLKLQLVKIEEDIKRLANEPSLNISSPKQLGEVLFEKLKITNEAKTTSKTKQYSTSESELIKYVGSHPIVQKILDFRSIKKLLSTYIETLPLLVNPKTHRIHASFNQAVASTGRLSSNNPNLQNIPIRDENGKEIRKAFIPSDSEHLILSADYSQIELRIMAHVSADQHMLEAFKSGEDIHAATASKIFKTQLAEVTREQRSRAKTANFGMIYGISAFGLAQRMGISRTEAKELIEGYFSTYTGIKSYMEACISTAREKGFVQTIFGRKKALPDITSGNAIVRGVAERNAINAPIQGSAADIIKLAMIRVHAEFKKHALKSKLIIQVHDELVFDVYKPELEQVKLIVKSCMENAATLQVPLVVELGVGNNWLEAH